MTLFNNLKHNLFDPIDTEAGDLNSIPNSFIRQSIFMSLDAIFQAFLDVILEVGVLLGVFGFYLPFRLEFLFLTFLSTLIAYFTLAGMREGNLDVTKNSMLLGLAVETALVLGDIYLLINTWFSKPDDFWMLLLVRSLFLILTSLNIVIISKFLIYRTKVKKSRPKFRF